MIAAKITELNADHIKALVTAGVPESSTLDFKRDLPGENDEAKRELRADVCSFANAEGGDIVFGIEEADGAASQVFGASSAEIDAKMLWIGSVISSSIEPKIRFEIKRIQVDGKTVVVLRVFPSWTKPHLVKNGDSFRAYVRRGASKQTLGTYSELKEAFQQAGMPGARIKRWRDERILQIMEGDTPFPNSFHRALVVHVVSISAFMDQESIPVEVMHKNRALFRPFCNGGAEARANLDGLVTTSLNSDEIPQPYYTQVFRFGAVEGACENFFATKDKESWIMSQWVAEQLAASVSEYCKGLENSGAEGPFAVETSIIAARGMRLAVAPRLALFNPSKSIDRDIVHFPGVVIEDPSNEVINQLRPVLDALWNACGYVRCMDFNADGRWAPKPG